MGTKVTSTKEIIQPQQFESDLASSRGQIAGRAVGQAPRSAKIQFERTFLKKTEDASVDMRGSIAITQDDNHKGWLHVLIYIGQLFNAIITGKKLDNVNYCHSQIIIGINNKDGRKGEFLLAHAVFGGIKTTSESHKKDEVITGVNIYKPVDEKMRSRFEEFAKQTAVNFSDAKLNPKSADFKSRVKKEVGQFSIPKMILSVFHRQVLKPVENVQRLAAYAAADLLRGDKFRDEKGNLASYFCTGYVMTLTQGTALVAALSDEEQNSLKDKSRDEIAQYILDKIKDKKNGGRIAATYWENEFMQLDARNTLSYAAGDILNKATVVKESLPYSPAAVVQKLRVKKRHIPLPVMDFCPQALAAPAA